MRRERPLIVLVDDDPSVTLLMHDVLGEEGWDCRSFGTGGEEPYAFIVGEQPDLVILDLRLGPRDDGFALLQAVRGHPGGRDIPVLVWSADKRMLDGRAEELRRLGCGVVEKPFELDELLGEIRAQLGGGVAPGPGLAYSA